MTVNLVYDPLISRVQITADGLGLSTAATVERSTDGIRWTSVRGSSVVLVVGGEIARPISDFEFPSTGIPVTYRVTGFDPTPASYIGVGTGSTGSSGSRTPGLPAGIVAGDALVMLASTRNSGTGTPDTPAGWDHLLGTENVQLFGQIWDGVSPAPTVTYTGGAVNEDTLAQIAAFRLVSLTPASGVMSLNSTPAQNIAFPGQGTLARYQMLVLYFGWKADDWTSVATVTPGFTVEISELTSTAGSDAGQVWNYYLPATNAAINPGSFAVTGGGAAISRGGTLALQHAGDIVEQTATITPNIGAVWLKSISRPFLNRPVDTRLASTITVSRKSRAAVFPVIGRSFPIAVSSIRGSREWTMLVRTEGTAERDNTELLLATGDVLFIQAPPDSGVETGYVSVGDITREAHPLRPLSWLFTMPMTEVAEPGPEIVGTVGTWLTVRNHYASWSAVLADQPTWVDVLSIVGDATEVIVP